MRYSLALDKRLKKLESIKDIKPHRISCEFPVNSSFWRLFNLILGYVLVLFLCFLCINVFQTGYHFH